MKSNTHCSVFDNNTIKTMYLAYDNDFVYLVLILL